MPVNNLLQYDDVFRQQREIIYNQRDEVLESENLREIVEKMIIASIQRNVDAHALSTRMRKNGIYKGSSIMSMQTSYVKVTLPLSQLHGKDPEEIIETIFAKVKERYEEKEQMLSPEQMREFEKVITLRAVDPNGLITLMRWINFAKEFIFVHTDKLTRFVNISMKDLPCLKQWLLRLKKSAQYIS